MAAEVKMAAKLVNLGFGFGPQRNPRSGPPRVSREGGGGREAGGGKGEEERAREGRGGEGKRLRRRQQQSYSHLSTTV